MRFCKQLTRSAELYRLALTCTISWLALASLSCNLMVALVNRAPRRRVSVLALTCNHIHDLNSTLQQPDLMCELSGQVCRLSEAIAPVMMDPLSLKPTSHI